MQVESDRAGVNDVDPRLVLSRLVHHCLAQRPAQEVVDAAGAVEHGARLAPELRRTAQLCGEVQLLPELVDLVGGVGPRGDVKGGRVRGGGGGGGGEVGLRPGGVVLKRQPVPVQVPARVGPRRGRGVGRLAGWGGHALGGQCGCAGAREAAVVGAEAGHGQPAERLAVQAALEGRAGLVVHLEVADVAVSAKDLDRGGRVHLADGAVDVAKGAGGGLLEGGVVADEQEQVDGAWGVGEEGLEPGLVNHGRGGDDFGDVGVTLEVEEDAKGQDAESVLGGQVLVLVAEILILIGRGVEDLDVGGEVPVAPDLGELVVVLIRNVGVVELMIACRRGSVIAWDV